MTDETGKCLEQLKTLTVDDLEHVGSMIMIKGTDKCLGSLLYFEERGVFDAEYGKIPISKGDSETHNRCFDESMIRGLEECAVGAVGMFYRTGNSIHTWTGIEVCSDLFGDVFDYRGHRYKVIPSEGDMVLIQRVSDLAVEETAELKPLRYVVMQQGGATCEWYCNVCDTLEAAQACCESAGKASYNTSEPVEIPALLVDSDERMEALIGLLDSLVPNCVEIA